MKKIGILNVENVVSFSGSWKEEGEKQKKEKPDALVLAAPAHIRSDSSLHSLPVLFTLAFTCSLSLSLSLALFPFVHTPVSHSSSINNPPPPSHSLFMSAETKSWI